MKQTTPHGIDLHILVRVAVLVALNVLLMNYFGIHSETMKIGFSFLPIALCGMMYGARWSTACALTGDLLNCVFGGFPWFPPLTLSACINGFVYGAILKNRSNSMPAIFAAAVITQVAVGLFLNTWFLSILYTSPYGGLLVTRIPQTLVMLVLQVITLRLVGAKNLVSALSGHRGEALPEKNS